MKQGFTLIELMIVVAIIAIIAAIAIPSLMRSRIAANETAAAASCKAYGEAQEIYHRTDYDADQILEYATSAGPTTIANSLADFELIDTAFANAFCATFGFAPPTGATPKAGYVFMITTSNYDSAGLPHLWRVGNNLTLGYGCSVVASGYDTSGRNNFQYSNAGTVYQGDRTSANRNHMHMFSITANAWGAPTWIPCE